MAKKFLPFAVFVGLYFIFWISYTFFLDVPFNEKRLTEGILLLLGVGLLCSSRVIQQRWIEVVTQLKDRNRVIIWILCGIAGLGVISCLLANYPNYAFLQLGHYFLLFNLMIICVIGYRFNPKYFEYGFLIVVGLAAALYLVNVVISYLYVFLIPDFPVWPGTDFTRIKFEDIGFMYPEPFSNFVNFRFFNHLQTWTLPLLSLLVIKIPKRYWAFSKLAFIVLCGWWMLVFASDARGTMLASFLALGFVFFMYKDKAQKWIRSYSLSAVIGLVSYFLFFKLFPLLVNTTSHRTAFSRYGDQGRLEVWESAVNVILQNPLFGVGPMHFTQIGSELIKNPHNIYLQLFSEWGLIAGILFIAIVAGGFYFWIVNCNKVIYSSASDSKEITVRVALTTSLLAALMHGFTSNIFNSPLSQIMMVLVVGWMIGLSISGDNQEEVISNNLWKRAGLIGINLLAAGFLIWSYAVQVPNLDENRQRYLEITKENRLTPRYWDQGVIGLEKYDNELNEQSASE